MARSKNSIANQLHAAEVSISNTVGDPEIQALVAAYGYNAAKMDEGKQLHAAAVSAVNAQTAAAGAQRAATAQLQTAETAARDAYQSLAQVARAIFPRASAPLATLGLKGVMPRATAAFLAAATTLFDNALSDTDIQTMLAGYGYDAAKLQGERDKVIAVREANQSQEAAKGSAQQATQMQDAALKALNDWTAQFLKIARVVLREKPQLLEKMGVAARTSRARRTAKPNTPASVTG